MLNTENQRAFGKELQKLKRKTNNGICAIISLISIVAKCYNSVSNNRVQQYLEDNRILSDAQNGFRLDRSCKYHVFFPLVYFSYFN